MLKKEVTVINPKGIHVRPASRIAETASKFKSSVTFENERKTVNGKSMMGLLGLAALYEEKITIYVNGEDEEAALKEIEDILQIIY